MVALPFAVGVGASEGVTQLGGVVTLVCISLKKLGCLSPPAGVEGRRNPFDGINSSALRIGERPLRLVEVGYLDYFIHH